MKCRGDTTTYTQNFKTGKYDALTVIQRVSRKESYLVITVGPVMDKRSVTTIPENIIM